MGISDENQLEEVIQEKVEERVEERMKEERKKIKQELREQIEGSKNVSSSERRKISRRQFLKMLSFGAGSLALSSAAAGISWTKITPLSKGTSGINAETATKYKENDIDSNSDGEVDAADIARALDSSQVGDGLNGGGGTALSIDVSDFAGSGVQDDGNDNLELVNSPVPESKINAKAFMNSYS